MRGLIRTSLHEGSHPWAYGRVTKGVRSGGEGGNAPKRGTLRALLRLVGLRACRLRRWTSEIRKLVDVTAGREKLQKSLGNVGCLVKPVPHNGVVPVRNLALVWEGQSETRCCFSPRRRSHFRERGMRFSLWEAPSEWKTFWAAQTMGMLHGHHCGTVSTKVAKSIALGGGGDGVSEARP